MSRRFARQRSTRAKALTKPVVRVSRASFLFRPQLLSTHGFIDVTGDVRSSDLVEELVKAASKFCPQVTYRDCTATAFKRRQLSESNLIALPLTRLARIYIAAEL